MIYLIRLHLQLYSAEHCTIVCLIRRSTTDVNLNSLFEHELRRFHEDVGGQTELSGERLGAEKPLH